MSSLSWSHVCTQILDIDVSRVCSGPTNKIVNKVKLDSPREIKNAVRYQGKALVKHENKKIG